MTFAAQALYKQRGTLNFGLAKGNGHTKSYGIVSYLSLKAEICGASLD